MFEGSIVMFWLEMPVTDAARVDIHVSDGRIDQYRLLILELVRYFLHELLLSWDKGDVLDGSMI
jgi:hypothetical protein